MMSFLLYVYVLEPERDVCAVHNTSLLCKQSQMLLFVPLKGENYLVGFSILYSSSIPLVGKHRD